MAAAAASAMSLVNGIEDVMGVDGAELTDDRLIDLRVAVADVAVPKRGHAVENLTTVRQCQNGALSRNDSDEVRSVLRRDGERMEEVAHPRKHLTF